MVKIKLYFISVAVLVLSMIITFGWFGILEWDSASNFVSGMLFWIICCVCVAVSFVLLKLLKHDFPFKVTIVMVNILYYITLVLLICFGVFTIPKMVFIFTNLIIFFLYLIISVPIMLMSFNKEEDLQ